MTTSIDHQSNNNNGMFDGNFDEDDADAWSPLNHDRATNGSHTPNTSTVHIISTALPRQNAVREDSTTSQTEISTAQSSSIQKLMINKPLSRFGRMFLLHFVTELWSYHFSIRLGILFLLFAVICQVMSLVYLLFITICNLLNVLTLFLLGFAAYLYLFQIDNNISQKYWRAALKVPEGVLDAAFLCLESIDGRGMRRIALAIFMIPTLLEMWTLTFLARALGESGVPRDEDGRGVLCGWSICYKFLFLELILIVPLYYHISMDNDSNCSITNNHNEPNLHGGSGDGMGQIKSALKIGKMIITKKATTTLSKCRAHALMYLYISTLLATTFTMKYGQIHRPILLAAPFLFASGTLLFLFPFFRRGDEGSVLSELVQSAIRFALKDALEHVGEDVAEDEMLKLAMLRWIVDYWTFSLSPSSPTDPLPSDNNKSTCTERPPIQTSSSAVQNEVSEEGGISWYALATMLGMTTAQMQNEVPPTLSGDNKHCNQNSSVCKLQHMLSSLDVDKRAKPAVMSYEKGVEECPPSRWVAIILAFMRRCPSLFSIMYLYMSGSIYRVHITITLSPLILLELIRMKHWSNSCCRAMAKPKGKEDDHDTDSFWTPIEMDPMTILLSRDNYSPDNVGPALQVWGNLKHSVVALKSGLTAMRCIQTAQLATELVFDVISLAKFASEVSRHNVPHRLGIIALDIWHLYVEKSSTESSQSCGKVFSNIQSISRNIQKVAHEGRQEGNAFTPIINGANALLNHKWLYQDEVQTSEQIDSGNEIDQVPATADAVVSEDLKHNIIVTDNCQLKINDAKGVMNERDECASKLVVGIDLKENSWGIDEHSEEPLNIKHDIKNENTAPMFSKVLHDTAHGESAEMLEDFKVEGVDGVEGVPAGGLDQSLVDGLDWNNKKSNEKCIIMSDSVKEVSQGSQNREPSKKIEFESKYFSESSDATQDKNTESGSMVEDDVAQDISKVENQSPNDRIEVDSKNEERKCGVTKNDIKIASQDNTNRELSIVNKCEANSLSNNSDNNEPKVLFDLIEDKPSFTSDDGGWTEIEHIDLNTTKLQTLAVIDIQERNVSANNLNVCNETSMSENINDSKLTVLGAGLAALGTVIGSIATVNSRDKKEENASTLMHCNRRSNIEKIERVDE